MLPRQNYVVPGWQSRHLQSLRHFGDVIVKRVLWATNGVAVRAKPSLLPH
jgi:hypothetical protein